MCGAICHFVAVLWVLFSSIQSGYSQSPCPKYFRYMKNDVTGEIYGRIQIPRPPRNIALHIKISLSVPGGLPTAYVGRLELATSKFDAINAVYDGKNLVYNLYFPIRHPVPILTEITFNGLLYCRGSGATSGLVTTIFLEHTLHPPSVVALSDDPQALNNHDYSKIHENRPGTDFSPSRPNFLSNDEDGMFSPQESMYRPDFPSNDRNLCGRSGNEDYHHLIAHGAPTFPGQWPWLVAIFLAKRKIQFHCAGSLITDKHILTAAHCKYDDGVNMPASSFLMALGRYRLNEWREKDAQPREISNFRIHPDYKNHFNADADIAIVTLRTNVVFTPTVQPVCLWSGSGSLDRIIGLTGYIVGWGKDENGDQYLREPRIALAPIVSQEDCLRSDIAFFHATSNRTFCAGRRDGSGPCNGDSGTGLLIRHSKTGLYHLRGIVSLSLLDKDFKYCDLSRFIVYVDAAKFTDWIKENIKE